MLSLMPEKKLKFQLPDVWLSLLVKQTL